MRLEPCVKKSNNIGIMMGSEANEIIEELLNLFCKNIKMV